MGQVTQSMAGMNFVAQPQAPNMMTGSMFLYKQFKLISYTHGFAAVLEKESMLG